jgi:hypothetical protein
MPSSITINGVSYRGSSVAIRGGKVIIDGKEQEGEPLSGVVEVKVTGVLQNLKCDASVVCGDVKGNVSTGGSVTARDVGGSVSAGGSIFCGDVKGSITAGGSVVRGPAVVPGARRR